MEDLAPGKLLGHYTIEHVLTGGGMGNLYLARDETGRQVVIKFPHLNLLGDPALFERYQRELEIGRRLHHRNLQQVLSTGEYDGQPFMVTAYVAGESLRAYLSHAGPLAIEDTRRILMGLCAGIAYCHANGVFHRDLKPENVLLTAEGDPVIIDFGIALLRGARRITFGGMSGTVGTPDYMAPEQIQGKRGDARTDIYALGAIGYELVTGQPPFNGDNPLAVMSQHLYGDLKPPSSLRPDLPPPMDDAIVRALRRDPQERFPSIEAFAAAFQSTAVATPIQASATTTHHSVRSALWSRLRVLLVIMAIMVGIVLLGVLAQALHQGN